MDKTARQVPGKKVADQALVARLTTLLQSHEEVRAAYLFGSRARGSHRPGSDVDVAVAFASPASAWDEVELQEQLEAQLGVPVQVIDLARAGPHIVEAVQREGVRLAGDAQVLVEEPKGMAEEGPEVDKHSPTVVHASSTTSSGAPSIHLSALRRVCPPRSG